MFYLTSGFTKKKWASPVLDLNTSFYQFLAHTFISGDAVTSLVTRTRFEIPGGNSGDAHLLVREKNYFLPYLFTREF